MGRYPLGSNLVQKGVRPLVKNLEVLNDFGQKVGQKVVPEGGPKVSRGVSDFGSGVQISRSLSKIGFLHGFGGFCDLGVRQNVMVFDHLFITFCGFSDPSGICHEFWIFWSGPVQKWSKSGSIWVPGGPKKGSFLNILVQNTTRATFKFSGKITVFRG